MKKKRIRLKEILFRIWIGSCFHCNFVPKILTFFISVFSERLIKRICLLIFFFFLQRKRFRSEKIRSFMQTVLEKEKVPLYNYLTEALLSTSVAYGETIQRAMAIPDCPVVPFFGSFMLEIRKIMKETPSSIVLSDQDDKVLSEVNRTYVYLRAFGWYTFADPPGLRSWIQGCIMTFKRQKTESF